MVPLCPGICLSDLVVEGLHCTVEVVVKSFKCRWANTVADNRNVADNISKIRAAPSRRGLVNDGLRIRCRDTQECCAEFHGFVLLEGCCCFLVFTFRLSRGDT